MKPRLFITVVLVLFFCAHPSAQQAQNIQLLQETEGLIINNIISDHSGQIWLATYNNGLMKYNGYEFKKFEYNPEDSASIKGNAIQALHEDLQKKIWLSTLDGELIRYDPLTKKMKKYNFQSLIGKKYLEQYVVIIDIRTIRGQLFFTISYNSPLSKSILTYDAKKDQLKIFAPNSSHPDYAYFFTPKTTGEVLVSGQDAQLYALSVSPDTITRFPFSELQDLNNRSILAGDARYDHQGKFWALSKNAGLYRFDDVYKSPNKIYSFKHLIPQGVKEIIPMSIEFDSEQNIWIGSFQGLFFFNRLTEHFTKINLPPDVNGNPYKINKLFFDHFNNLWIGTQTGLLKYENKPVFHSYSGKTTDTALLVKGYVGGLLQLKSGKISFGTYEEVDGKLKIKLFGLDLNKNRMNQVILSDILPEGANIMGGGEAGLDTFVVGSDQGVYQFTNNLKTVKKINLPGLPTTHPGIIQFFKDKYGNEWLGSLNYLYKKLKGSEKFIPIDLSTQPGGSDQSNSVIVEDGKQHGLWIISQNGLFLYDYKTDKFTRHGYDSKNKSGFNGQEIYTTYTEDGSTMVWIGIKDGGLNKYDLATGKIKTYTTQDGLPDMSVYSILNDEKNNALWLGTENGICRFNKQTEQFTKFSAADGISGKAFSTGVKTLDGQMLFGGNGLIRFNPDDIRTVSLPPLVSISDLKVSNKSITSSLDSLTNNTSIRLRHTQNHISIDFLAVHYTDAKNNKFSYILEGFDTEWNPINQQQTAYYTNLPVGQYTFKVKAANSNGIWNEEGARLHITILPPWWKTIWAFIGYGILAIGLGSILNTYFKNRVLKQERQRSQLKVLEQAKEIEKAYKELGQSHESLKSTQSQLIHAEKMASLGELTAGIAHEIQNPLNFVNNFSDINLELIEEMKYELTADHKQQALELADTIKSNLEKITTHGRRADSIVKGMLQHSRKSNSSKESTDINALADEYLRLAYHGLRAKDKSFNAIMRSDLDPNLGLIQAIPQDIGRVLLNLITNAFHAVTEKDKIIKAADPESAYAPLVTVITKKIKPSMGVELVEIQISDNGSGIPDHLKDKIFQPFFTTKPTGQGTGLGLSLAYDIIKAHQGTIEVDSSVTKGTIFTIHLPLH